jgi:hypothetical protein
MVYADVFTMEQVNKGARACGLRGGLATLKLTILEGSSLNSSDIENTPDAPWISMNFNVISELCSRVQEECRTNTSEHDLEFWFIHFLLERFPNLHGSIFIENQDTVIGQLPDVVIGRDYNKPSLCLEFLRSDEIGHAKRLRNYCDRYSCHDYLLYFKEAEGKPGKIVSNEESNYTRLMVPVWKRERRKELDQHAIERIFSFSYSSELMSSIVLCSRLYTYDGEATLESRREDVWKRTGSGIMGELAKINGVYRLVTETKAYYKIRLENAKAIKSHLTPEAQALLGGLPKANGSEDRN